MSAENRPTRPRLRSRMVIPSQLTPINRARMHALMSNHFENIELAAFERDLAEKDWALVMEDEQGEIQGFTTLMILEGDNEGEKLLGFYSGDTVIAPEYWGDNGWLTTWSQHVIDTAERHRGCRPYWILLTATHRTYRFLPGFFKEYYPRPDQPTPASIQRVLNEFVSRKFPEEYDPQRGVVTLKQMTPVRDPSAVAAGVPLHDEHARFFIERNRGYLNGDFLACITEMTRANGTKLGLRVLGNLPTSSV